MSKEEDRWYRDQIQFRHDPRNLFVSDYISNAMVEYNQIINIQALFEGKNKSQGPTSASSAR